MPRTRPRAPRFTNFADIYLRDGQVIGIRWAQCPRCDQRTCIATCKEGEIRCEWVHVRGDDLYFEPHHCGVTIPEGLPGEPG
jgi:hypothetical protein